MSYYDPRENLTREVQVGDVYTDSRTGEELRVVYEDEDVVLCRTDYYRLDSRQAFEENVGSGRYEFDRNDGHSVSSVVRSLEQKADELEEEDGYKPTHKATGIRMAIDELEHDPTKTIEFEEISGVGEKTADALRENGITTTKDVESASDDELLSVSGVGEANLENIRDV